MKYNLWDHVTGKAEREKKRKKAEKESIMCNLPGFVNQLILLLNCGMIFNDAFDKIVNSYSLRQEDRENYFKNELCHVAESARQTNASPVVTLNAFARSSGVREFIRITGIILDSQYRGTDLRDKLEAEGEILWQQRKKLAEEKGKLAETKLTFPLAMLLVVLIIITAAPAILQI
ncbi:MAG TPA: type II secretion system F family protein [Anaerovoracaceae bacterium]|nr:type II secretion system F family protein [Anaerovoracaceae bacterium]